MPMYIPCDEIRKAGTDLESIAQRMQRLSNRANSINSAISSCYMQGGVGRRAGNAASQMQCATSQARLEGEKLCIGAGIYERKEHELTNQCGTVANTIENGYNVSWCSNPAVKCVIGTTATTATVASESVLKKFLGNDLKTDGTVGSWGAIDYLSGKAGFENSANWDVKNGNIGVGVKASASGSLLKTENEGRIGIAKGGYEVKVGTAEAEGKATFNVMSSGELNPKLELSAKAEAHGISGKLEGSLGSDDLDVHLKGEGSVGKAEAEAKLAISKDGIGGKAEVGAAALSGKATLGFNIFGVKIDASIKGEAGSIGAGAEFGVSDQSFEIGGKLSFIAGLGLKIKVSW